MKVLIIEDAIDSAILLKQLLQIDHEVFIAHTARDALAAGMQNKPDLIISDWDLKDEIDGVEVCRQILEFHEAVIIFVSGSPLEQFKEAANALTPLQILGKPIDLDNLESLLRDLQIKG